MLECAIVTQAAYEASPDQMATTPVGTSAYLVDSYVPGSEIVMKDTGDYWQTDESLVHGTSIHNVGEIPLLCNHRGFPAYRCTSDKLCRHFQRCSGYRYFQI